MKTPLTFSLPEDQEVDQLIVKEAPDRNSPYEPILTVEYKYGMNTVEVELNSTRWYRIQFYNTKTGRMSQDSEPVYAGNKLSGAPSLFVSSNTDGANYATTQDVYDYSGLTPQDVPQARVSTALKKARAHLDYRLKDIRNESFLTFPNEVRRRKYNAALQLCHEAEMCVALSHIYDSMSDKLILHSMRDEDNSPSVGSASLGGTTVSGDSLAERTENLIYLSSLAAKYKAQGEKLLDMLDPNNVPLVSYEDHVRSPRFKFPFHGWKS